MKAVKRRVMCILCAALVLMSVVALPGLNVQAAENAGASEWVDPIDSEKILYDFRAEDFTLPYAPDNGDAVVDDPDSPFGKAASFSYATRLATGDAAQYNAMIRGGDQTLAMYTYGGDPKIIASVGEISIAQLKSNAEMGKYVLYHFEDVDLIPTSDDYFIYIFDCWGMQQRFTEEQRSALMGQLVDVYLSLKVTGNVSSAENPPTYYIDRIVIATATPGTDVHEHSFGEWVGDIATHNSTCSGCGEVQSEAHTWDEGVVTKEATSDESGEKVYTCSVCSYTKTERLAKLANDPATDDPAPSQNQSNAPSSNVGMWVGISLLAVAVVVVVIALVMRRRGNK